MSKVLLIEASPNGEKSISRKAGQLLLAKLKAKSQLDILAHDLSAKELPHVDGFTLTAFYTPEDKREEKQKHAVLLSDQFVSELLAADTVVITTPMWNFHVPSSLKAWTDHIVRSGKTFRYESGKSEGLLAGKTVYVLIAAGDVYSATASEKIHESLNTYFNAVFAFVGITDVRILWLEGTSIPGKKQTVLDEFANRLDRVIHTDRLP